MSEHSICFIHKLPHWTDLLTPSADRESLFTSCIHSDAVQLKVLVCTRIIITDSVTSTHYNTMQESNVARHHKNITHNTCHKSRPNYKIVVMKNEKVTHIIRYLLHKPTHPYFFVDPFHSARPECHFDNIRGQTRVANHNKDIIIIPISL
jgi:hypothetical protein